MLGSSAEADDAVQDTIVRAWRSLDRFDGHASVRTWLYRIATNVCLNALNDRKRRVRPMEEETVNTTDDPLVERPGRTGSNPFRILAPFPPMAILRKSQC
jgi:RNA polymerase sigma-70 factor (ECF subfamily)